MHGLRLRRSRRDQHTSFKLPPDILSAFLSPNVVYVTVTNTVVMPASTSKTPITDLRTTATDTQLPPVPTTLTATLDPIPAPPVASASGLAQPNSDPSPTPIFINPITVPSLNPTPSSTDSTSISSAAASSGNGTTKSSLHTGSVIGGVAGALLGMAVLVIAVWYFLRRWQQREPHDFNITAFKQQSALLNDEPPSAAGDHQSTPGGFAPLPPSMIERRLSNITGDGRGMTPPLSPGEIIQPAIAITSPPPGTSVPFFVPSRPPSLSPVSPYHDLPYDDPGSVAKSTTSRSTPRSLPSIPPLALSPSTFYPSGSSIPPYYTAQRSGVFDRTSGQAESPTDGTTEGLVRLSDFPPVPDSGVSGTSGRAVYVGQAGLHQALSPFMGVPSSNTVPESPFADPHIQAGSQPRRIPPTDPFAGDVVDTGSERTSSIGPLPEIHFQVLDHMDMLRVSSSEFPVSALANSFAIPSPPVRDSLEKPQPPAVVVKPSPLREATTASVSSPSSASTTPRSTRDIKGKGKAKMTDSFYESDEYPYSGI